MFIICVGVFGCLCHYFTQTGQHNGLGEPLLSRVSIADKLTTEEKDGEEQGREVEAKASYLGNIFAQIRSVSHTAVEMHFTIF